MITVVRDLPRDTDDIDADVRVFHAAPMHYLVDRAGWDPTTTDDLEAYTFGPAPIRDALFICPDCQTRGDPRLTVTFGPDVDDPNALLECRNCPWEQQQDPSDWQGSYAQQAEPRGDHDG